MTGAAARAASLRFKPWPHIRWYCLGKALSDPAYPHVALRLASSTVPVLDIGCGAGTLAAYLRASGLRAPIHGIDRDPKKTAVATAALASEHCLFESADARNLPAHSGHVVALDVLHYLDRPQRATLIADIAARLAPGALGLIRTTLRDASWRFALTRCEEWFVRSSGWIPFPSKGFPDRQELLEAAQAAGLHSRFLPMFGATPFNSHMLEVWNHPPS